MNKTSAYPDSTLSNAPSEFATMLASLHYAYYSSVSFVLDSQYFFTRISDACKMSILSDQVFISRCLPSALHYLVCLSPRANLSPFPVCRLLAERALSCTPDVSIQSNDLFIYSNTVWRTERFHRQ
uniref:Uncharacterized protein n=1 Tax=Heterorhabditis bacteriophora TaxID=37862 RepID=A0A1I7X9Z5_HETBA